MQKSIHIKHQKQNKNILNLRRHPFKKEKLQCHFKRIFSTFKFRFVLPPSLISNFRSIRHPNHEQLCAMKKSTVEGHRKGLLICQKSKMDFQMFLCLSFCVCFYTTPICSEKQFIKYEPRSHDLITRLVCYSALTFTILTLVYTFIVLVVHD